jgi:hypothetical protein
MIDDIDAITEEDFVNRLRSASLKIQGWSDGNSK